MKPCRRLEIVVESAMVNTVIELFKELDIPGYTLVPDIRGCGDRGLSWADDLAGDATNSLFLVACDEPEKVDALLESLRPILSRSGGICLVSDAMWLRH